MMAMDDLVCKRLPFVVKLKIILGPLDTSVRYDTLNRMWWGDHAPYDGFITVHN
jgi:hypothetical protein